MSGTSPENEASLPRPKVDIVGFMKGVRKATHFREIDGDLVVIGDPVGLAVVRSEEGTTETYLGNMAAIRANKDGKNKDGRREAVSYGVGTIGKHQVVEVIFNWEFMGGSSGVVAGEKFVRAMHLAVDANLPMIVMCASGGQRQQEGVAALREMTRTVYALDEFKKRTSQPLIFTLVGNVMGGLTASGVPMADLVVGIEGTNMGFAGPKVIETYQGGAPPPGSQSVENSFATNRNVQVVVKDQNELLNYLEKTLDIVGSGNESPSKPRHHTEISGLYFDRPPGFHLPTRPSVVFRRHPRSDVPIVFEKLKPGTVWDQHMVLSGDPRRPDTLYILRHAFDGFIPFFSGKLTEESDGKHLRYPPIVAALAYIDDPRLPTRLMRMVIGSQPSYLRLPDGKVMFDYRNSSPTAWDFQYELKMIDFAKRLRRQIVTFVNTFGARPTLEDELAGQYSGIGHALQAQLEFPFFTSGYLIGIGGSGGHLALDFTADYAAMLEGAQEFVAEPRSAAAILFKRVPGPGEIQRTAEGVKPTAEFLLERGLIDRIIMEPQDGAQNNPLQTVLAIREDIIRVEKDFGHLTPDQIMERRRHRIETSRPIPIGHLNGGMPSNRKSRLARLLHI